MIPAAQARDILRGQFELLFGFEPPWPALRILLAQSRQEGQWGAFGGYDAEGNYAGFNWGGVQAKASPPCPAGTFTWTDSRPTAHGQESFGQCFVGYVTSEAGARDFLHHALELRSRAMKPLLAGDVWGYARALRELGYYWGFSTTLGEGAEQDADRRWEQIAGYADMLDLQGAEVDRALGLAPLGHTPKPPKPALALGSSSKPSAATKGKGRPLGWIVTVATFGLPFIFRK